MHTVAVSGVFAANPFGPGSIVSKYYTFPVYKDFYERQHAKKTYGEHIMAVTWDTSKKWANKSPETVNDSNQVDRPARTVPAQFHVMPYINDERYFPRTCHQSMTD